MNLGKRASERHKMQESYRLLMVLINCRKNSRRFHWHLGSSLMRRNHPTKLARPEYDVYVRILCLTEVKTHPIGFIVLEIRIYGVAEFEHLSINISQSHYIEGKINSQHTMLQRSLFVAL